MTASVETPERIWIESDGECPYFYHEEELFDVSPPTTEYVRADKLRAEIEVLRAEVERDEALLRQALEALESSDWYIGQLEWLVYSPDDTGTHEERAKVQSAIAALRERLGEGEQQ